MKARVIIDGMLDPKRVLRYLSAARSASKPTFKPTFKPRRMTPREIQRLANIMAMGPITKRPIDDRFLAWGYIEYYEDGEHDAVVVKPGFAEAFYNHPEIGGAYGDEWSDVPHYRRGIIRRYEAQKR